MEEYVKLQIEIKKDTFNEILNLIGFENFDNKTNDKGLPSNHDITDFISGCVNTYIKQINALAEMVQFHELGKPYQLKNRFKEIFQNKGLKQVQISKMTGIDRSNISMILANKNQPSLDYFIRLWVAADCPPIHEVLYRENQKSQTKN
ncbi:MAG: helix-turn-helix transcriptional regulator [Acidobacterium ailaaui]|jgi:DNA-binding XRE family transcriptional regulator|nr:helix-turn-helix transcriptional regulator [Pseudacidobacterium ailaaui]